MEKKEQSSAVIEIGEVGHARLNNNAPEEGPLPSSLLETIVSEHLQDKKDAYEACGGLQGLAEAFGVDVTKGINEDDATASHLRQIYGTNRLPEPPMKTFLEMVKDAVNDTMLILLICAAIVSLILGCIPETSEDTDSGWIEGLAVLMAVLIVVMVTSVNNYQKEKQFRKLNAVKEAKNVSVVRGGVKKEIPVSDLQVGDVLVIQYGDKVPADCVFISGSGIETDESAATGEPDAKKKGQWFPEKEKNKNKKISPVFLSGSQVLSGFGTALVIAVGPRSFNGKSILALRVEEDETPLQEQLDHLAEMIGRGGIFIAAITLIALFIKIIVQEEDKSEGSWDSDVANKFVRVIITCITIIVVAVPEGLPLAVTISLAYGVKKMMRDNNLVRHLDACETMGHATVICSDKTGTLTQNRMTVVKGKLFGIDFNLLPHSSRKVQRQGSQAALIQAAEMAKKPEYELKEQAATEAKERDGAISAAARQFSKQVPAAALELFVDSVANNTTAYEKADEKTGKMIFVGNKTESALLDFCVSMGCNYKAAQDRWTLVRRFPFNSAFKRMSTIMSRKNEKGEMEYFLFCKGASEMILSLSTHIISPDGQVQPLEDQHKLSSEAIINGMASQCLRTIGLAYRQMSEDEVKDLLKQLEEEDAKEEDVEQKLQDLASGNAISPDHDLVLMGIVGIQDPVRDEVPRAVGQCMQAGVRVIMVTGDNIITAKNIAASCGIYQPDKGGVAIEGPEFRALSDEARLELCKNLQVVARSSPTDKQLLVKTLQSLDECVAVTGDGTNDAPALKMSDVGFAMGIAGTDVAKEASDVVLMDDNFASIVRAIMWGRNIYDSIRAFLQFQLTINVVAILIAFIGAVVSSESESPLKAVQLLWLNLIMDTFAALALATQAPTDDLLNFKPYNDKSLISWIMLRNMIGQGIYQFTVMMVLLYKGADWMHIERDGLEHLTIIFNTFVCFQLFNQINARKVHGEFNVFENLFVSGNTMFFLILLLEWGLQILIIFVGNSFSETKALDGRGWAVCLILGFLTLPVHLLVSAIPVPGGLDAQFTEHALRLRRARKKNKNKDPVNVAVGERPKSATGSFRADQSSGSFRIETRDGKQVGIVQIGNQEIEIPTLPQSLALPETSSSTCTAPSSQTLSSSTGPQSQRIIVIHEVVVPQNQK